MIVTHKITMDLQDKSSVPQIDATQDDQYTRNIAITLLSAGANWPVPGDAQVVIRYQKSDGLGGTYDTLPDGTSGWAAEENVLTLALAPQVLTCPGTVMLSATLIAGDQVISIFSMNLYVWPRVKEIFAESAPYCNVAGFLPGPVQAQTGQFLRVAAVDEEGRVREVTASEVAGTDGGLSAEAAKLLMEILEAAVYSADVSSKISGLKMALGAPDSGDGDSGGETPDQPDVPEVVTYAVTNNLTNVSSNNAAASVNKNTAYSATLTANDGYELDTVTVTMGGVDITEAACSGGVIAISSVTGNVVITATATEQSGEGTGKIVEMSDFNTIPNLSVNGGHIYSDNGTADAGIRTGGTTSMMASEVFDADTQVKITFAAERQIHSELFCGCITAEETLGSSMSVYYAEAFGSKTWVSNYSVEHTYTVRAGYRLVVGFYILENKTKDMFTVEVIS